MAVLTKLINTEYDIKHLILYGKIKDKEFQRGVNQK